MGQAGVRAEIAKNTKADPLPLHRPPPDTGPVLTEAVCTLRPLVWDELGHEHLSNIPGCTRAFAATRAP